MIRHSKIIVDVPDVDTVQPVSQDSILEELKLVREENAELKKLLLKVLSNNSSNQKRAKSNSSDSTKNE